MKVMLIDPWGINNIAYYTNGLCQGIASKTNLTLVTNYYYHKTTTAEYEILPIFFKYSEKMSHNGLRKIVRGIEYITAYKKIIKELKTNPYDIVHIQWLLQYSTDIYFLKEIKKHCQRLVYTAHNVLPHINSEQAISALRKIYSLVDKIVLHGEQIRSEFRNFFPEYDHKVVLQRHGTYLNQYTQSDRTKVDLRITKKIEGYGRVLLFFGKIFYNKGVDRLVNMWLNNFQDEQILLVIAGQKSAEYIELDVLEPQMWACPNLLYLNKYVEDNLLSYLLNSANLVLLPYRHASMSGVIFTAAEFKKTVLCTDTGAISEYVVDGENSFVVENSNDAFLKKLKDILNNVSNETLSQMGVRLNKYISTHYSWENIGPKLVKDAYFG